MSKSEKAAVCRFCGQVYYGRTAREAYDQARDCEAFDLGEQRD